VHAISEVHGNCADFLEKSDAAIAARSRCESRIITRKVGVAGFGSEDFKGYLFRTAQGRSATLTGNPLAQSNVYRMIRRRAMQAGIKTRIGNHTFRATGITQYLRNGGRRELAQQMAAHESPRTTALYDRRDDEVAVDEVERILI
jgi:integrase/recombinase XerD